MRGVPATVGVLDDVGQPEPAEINGANVSMSGHITRMSRGSRRGVVVEEPDQHLAQHVDLAGGTVARVHLEAPVVVAEPAAGPLLDRGSVVGAQVVLQPAEQGVGLGDVDPGR